MKFEMMGGRGRGKKEKYGDYKEEKCFNQGKCKGGFNGERPRHVAVNNYQ